MRLFISDMKIVLAALTFLLLFRCAVAHADYFNAAQALEQAGVTYGAVTSTAQPQSVPPTIIVCVKVKNTLQGDKIVCTEEIK